MLDDGEEVSRYNFGYSRKQTNALMSKFKGDLFEVQCRIFRKLGEGTSNEGSNSIISILHEGLQAMEQFWTKPSGITTTIGSLCLSLFHCTWTIGVNIETMSCCVEQDEKVMYIYLVCIASKPRYLRCFYSKYCYFMGLCCMIDI